MSLKPDAEFQAFLEEGRFMIQRSASSGRHVFYPRTIAPGTGEEDLEWVEASGRGRVYSFSVVRPKPPAQPYNVALVDLHEGPRMMTRIEGVEQESICIDMEVKAKITRNDEQCFVVFEPIDKQE